MSYESLKAKVSLYQGTKAFLAFTRKHIEEFNPVDADLFLMQVKQLESSLNEVYEQGDVRMIIQFSDDLIHLAEKVVLEKLEPLATA